jgi:hypothetical protein
VDETAAPDQAIVGVHEVGDTVDHAERLPGLCRLAGWNLRKVGASLRLPPIDAISRALAEAPFV